MLIYVNTSFLCNSQDEESISAVSVNSFEGKLQKLHTDGSFPSHFVPRAEPDISREALTGKIVVRYQLAVESFST